MVHFQEDLPSIIQFIKWKQITFSFPSVINPNDNTFTIEVVENDLNFLAINSSTLTVKSFDGNYGNYSLTIKLSESNGYSNYYPTTMSVLPTKDISIKEFKILKTKYMSRNKTLVNIPTCKLIY